ncbi:MAG: hypothetical protein KAS21_00190 [Candidatus Aminicenantes bacterium]|nr:hypothetical protein [Candidatus Aminicenantes bacterium]MCK5003473.1 hypothetical protein [Candidatus Aminicenantes bacterium]
MAGINNKINSFFKLIVTKVIFNSPVRLTRSGWGKVMRNMIGSLFVVDVRKLLSEQTLEGKEFTKIVSAVRIGRAWRYTEQSRHSEADEIIQEVLTGDNKIILDVGASDGQASVELINKLKNRLKIYYLTDICFDVDIMVKKNKFYFFYPDSKKCFMVISNRFTFYRDPGSFLNPLKIFSMFALCQKYDEKKTRRINLLNPDIVKLSEDNNKIRIIEWDLFDKWEEHSPDLIKVANVLNRAYFKKKDIKKGLNNFMRILKEGGFLLLHDNKHESKWSLFEKKNSVLYLRKNRNGGSEIEKLVYESGDR